MGIYSLNRTELDYYSEEEIVADESYNDKAKNEATYLDAVEEAAGYEIQELFENYEF